MGDGELPGEATFLDFGHTNTKTAVNIVKYADPQLKTRGKYEKSKVDVQWRDITGGNCPLPHALATLDHFKPVMARLMHGLENDMSKAIDSMKSLWCNNSN